MTTITTYGPGGFDPSKPDNNVVAVEEIEPDPDAPVTDAERIADLEDALAVLAAELLGGAE